MESRQVYMVVGEPSGDVHAAGVAARLLQYPGVRVRGAAGPRMRAAGVEAEFESDQWGTVSLAESLRRVPALWRISRQVLRQLLADPPKVLVLVDFGAFNLRLAAEVRRRAPGVRIVYYFPPGSWRPQPRSQAYLRALVDGVATPFAHSARALAEAGVPAAWVGHPVLERLEAVEDKAAWRRERGLPEAGPVIGLLPGSRAVERACIGRVMWQSLPALRERLPGAQFLWSVLPGRPWTQWDQAAAESPEVAVVEDSGLILQAADLGMVCMGTATLEAAAAGCVPVTVYRGTAPMWWQFKLVGVGTKVFAMPNLLLGRVLVPELIQHEFTPARLAQELGALWESRERREEVRAGLAEVRRRLGSPGASRRTAELIWRMMQGEPWDSGIGLSTELDGSR